jgi:hypothetical protein
LFAFSEKEHRNIIHAETRHRLTCATTQDDFLMTTSPDTTPLLKQELCTALMRDKAQTHRGNAHSHRCVTYLS